jgi:hypothetical protein
MSALSPNEPLRVAVRRCPDCGAILRRCDKCGTEIELREGEYATVKVDGHTGLKILCWICYRGLLEFEDRADRGALTAEERADLERWSSEREEGS